MTVATVAEATERIRKIPHGVPDDAIIVVRGITRDYVMGAETVHALRGVDLVIRRNEFVAVMGPSGSGKSTLLNIVGMIDTPTSGAYWFDGAKVSDRSEEDLVELRKQHVGFIFQRFNLLDDLTIHENVELPLVYLDRPKRERRVQVREALELVGLADRGAHKPRQLSGGQQQLVAIARAIVCDPKLILADEPTGNLDRASGAEVLDMLEALNEQGATVLMVTHSPSHAARAQRIVHLLDGKIVEAPAEASEAMEFAALAAM